MKILIPFLPVALTGFLLLNCRNQSSPGKPADSLSPGWKIERGDQQLSEEIKEISGWTFISDSTLAAICDSGNEPIIYLLDTAGNILHRTFLKAENTDFEDITTDGKGNVFIGDTGNNKNSRKQLAIYKVPISGLWEETVQPTQTTTFSYANQAEFPPEHSKRNFDAEALVWKNDSILVFTKCRAIPFTGKTNCYKIPDRAGHFNVFPSFTLTTGVRSWLSDAVTSAALSGDDLYLLTQDRMIQFDFSNSIPRKKSSLSIFPLSQKESISVRSNGTVYICDERQRVIGGGHIFRVRPRK